MRTDDIRWCTVHVGWRSWTNISRSSEIDSRAILQSILVTVHLFPITDHWCAMTWANLYKFYSCITKVNIGLVIFSCHNLVSFLYQYEWFKPIYVFL